MNKIEEEFLKYDFRTYRDYLKLNQVNTKAYLMIAELIDNSISSMDNNSKNGTWSKQLDINIRLEFGSKTTTRKKIHSIDVYKEDFIIVEDNAFGMDNDVLRGAMKLNRLNLTSKSAMNAHGRGLKQSGFYFGTDLIVSSNNGNESNKIGLELSKQESLDSKIMFEIEESDMESTGTEVLIRNINAKNRLTANAWESVKTALWERYKKYLSFGSKNKMTIDYDVNFVTGKEKSYIRGEDESIASVVSVIQHGNIDEVIKLAQKSIDTKIRNNSDRIEIETMNNAFEAIKKVLNEAKLDVNKLFEYELDLIFNGRKTNLKFWMLEKNKAKFRGLRVYEGDRAILHGPITQGELSTYTEWYNIAVRSGSTINRFAGEFDITECGLKTTTDKSTFDASREVREDINLKIMSVWEAFDSFVIQGREEEKKQKGTDVSQTESENIESIFNSKYNNQKVKFVEHDKKNNYVVINVEITKGELWKFILKININPRKKDIFEKQINQDDQSLIIVANTGNMFWKKIDTNKTRFSSELVQPLSILMGIQYIQTLKENGGEQIDTFEILNEGKEIFNGND